MDDINEAEQATLASWVSVAFDAAVQAGYIVAPWRPSREAYVAMRELYLFGFSPAEGAEAMFAPRH